MAAFGGKEHVTVSLKTGSLPQARHLLWGYLKDFDRMLADARALPDPTLPGRGKPGVRRVPEREERCRRSCLVANAEGSSGMAKAEYVFDPRVQSDAYFAPDHARVDAEVLEKVSKRAL